ncbi:unnamed protein product [Orchesella dallaii]|uniref:Uncharacterized protein n=1 Tax=Orchesella dallaii TaxID=48710 RepID=A0ABP1PZJ7_9HEXA
MASGQDIIDAIKALDLKINKAVTDLNTAVLGNTNMFATQAKNLSTLQTTVANVTTPLGSISTKIGTAATTHTTSTAHTTGSATASGSGSGSSGTHHTHTHAPTIDVTQGLPFPKYDPTPQKPYLHANGKTDKKDKFQSEKGSFSHEAGTDPANKNKMHEKEDALHEVDGEKSVGIHNAKNLRRYFDKPSDVLDEKQDTDDANHYSNVDDNDDTQSVSSEMLQSMQARYRALLEA